LIYRPDSSAGSFNTYSDNGQGKIEIGLKWKDPSYRTNLLLHEIIEAILTDDMKRWKDPAGYGDENRMIFLFDHDYLCSFADKVAAALRSVGVLNDGVI